MIIQQPARIGCDQNPTWIHPA